MAGDREVRLSILVPTFNRYGRLLRGLIYIQGLLKSGAYRDIFEEVEILIADGSTLDGLAKGASQARERVAKLVEELKFSIRINIFFQPAKHLYARLFWLSRQARGRYVTLMGDEDMLVFDHVCEWIDEMDLDPGLAAISGQYLNIKGFEFLGTKLKFCMEEGWTHGVDIDALDFKGRVFQWKVFGASGIPSFSYSIMRSEIFGDFASILEGEDESYTYCGSEILLNLCMLGHGKIKIKNFPYVLRDFTFLSHSSADQDWADESRDYKSLCSSLRKLNERYRSFSSEQEIQEFAGQMQKFSKYSSLGRFAVLRLLAPVQSVIGRSVSLSVSSSALASARRAWLNTKHICYLPSELNDVGAFDLSASLLIKKILNKARSVARSCENIY